MAEHNSTDLAWIDFVADAHRYVRHLAAVVRLPWQKCHPLTTRAMRACVDALSPSAIERVYLEAAGVRGADVAASVAAMLAGMVALSSHAIREIGAHRKGELTVATAMRASHDAITGAASALELARPELSSTAANAASKTIATLHADAATYAIVTREPWVGAAAMEWTVAEARAQMWGPVDRALEAAELSHYDVSVVIHDVADLLVIGERPNHPIVLFAGEYSMERDSDNGDSPMTRRLRQIRQSASRYLG